MHLSLVQIMVVFVGGGCFGVVVFLGVFVVVDSRLLPLMTVQRSCCIS